MLSKFAVTNYKNFEERVELDLTNSNKYKFNPECVRDGHVNKIIVMGNNGSGKTNLGYAMFDIVMVLTDNYVDPMQTDEGSFINGDGTSSEATFEYAFRFGKDEIEYMYRKSAPRKLTYEKFVLNGKTLLEFDYRKRKYNIDRKNFDGTENINTGDALDGSISFIRYISSNTLQNDDSIVKKIMMFVKNMLYVRAVDVNTFIGGNSVSPNENIEGYLIENGHMKEFGDFLKNYANLNVKLKGTELPGGKKTIVQSFRKKNLLFNPIASSGTRKMELLFYWYKRLDTPSFVFFDEFDANYHFELSENIIKFVISNYECQVLMTSHNTGLVSTKLMRPDCYFIISQNGIKSLANLTRRELRECHNLEKLMRAGEFND